MVDCMKFLHLSLLKLGLSVLVKSEPWQNQDFVVNKCSEDEEDKPNKLENLELFEICSVDWHNQEEDPNQDCS